MEIIGSLASITQLTRYAISLIGTISDIHQRIEARPAQLHQRILQLERLTSTIQILSRCEILDTPSVREHLESIITRTKDLNALLERQIAKQTQSTVKKYCKAWITDNKEQRIINTFSDLESDKSALLLSITATQAEISSKMYEEAVEGQLSTRGELRNPRKITAAA